jgi:hypothetical protein
VTTARLVAGFDVGGTAPPVSHTVLWAVSAAGYMVGLLFWLVPWTRVQLDQLFGAVVIGIALPLLYLSFRGQLNSRDVLPMYVAAAVFTAALLPLRTAMAAALLGAIAAAIPLLAGWTAYYDRALMVLVSVIGLLTYTQARMVGAAGQEKRRIQEKSSQMEESYMATISALAANIFAKDRSTESHSRGAAGLALAVGERMGIRGRQLRFLEYAAVLHDVGKAGLPGYLLNKPGKLTEDEIAQVRQHPVIAERILSTVPFLAPVSHIVRSQYERWNGSGYPDGLVGGAIPLGARILHASTAFHAMISDRPYRARLSIEDALRQLAEQAGKQFDPKVVAVVTQAVEAGDVQVIGSELPDMETGSGRYWMQQLETIEGLGHNLGLESGALTAVRLVGEALASLIGHDQCAILLVGSDGSTLTPGFLSPADIRTLADSGKRDGIIAADGVIGWVAESKKALLVEDLQKHRRSGPVPGQDRMSLVAAPILMKEQLLGVIVVTKVGLGQFSRQHLQLLQILANQLAVSMANARLIERLEASSIPVSQPAA